MKGRAQPGLWCALVAAALLLLHISCGGGGGTSGPPPPPPPQPLQIIDSSLQQASVGQPYNVTFRASGGTPPYSWGLAPSSGSLPPGLSLASNGALSGSPTLEGGFNFTVEVRDSAARTTTKPFTLSVRAPLTITTTSLPEGNVGIMYSFQLSFTGAVTGANFSLVPGSGSLPPGFSLGQEGRISGLTSTAGSFTFTIQVVDPSPPQTATRTFTLVINNRLTVIPTSGAALAVLTYPFSFTPPVVGGTLPYSWSFSFGRLPPGLSLNTMTGEISGVPTEVGYFSSYYEVRDSSQPTQTVAFGVGINVSPLLTILTQRLPDGVLNRGYAETVSIAGGRGPYSFRIASGSLPPGVSIARADVILQFGGTATSLGDFPFTLEVSDSSSPPTVVTRDYSIRVNPALVFETTTTNLPDALEGQPYSFAFRASSGVPPYAWFLFSCSGVEFNCPPGLNLNQITGEYSGIPTRPTAGQAYLYVSLRDSSDPPQEVQRQFQLKIIGILHFQTTQLPAVRLGTPMRLGLLTTGGVLPYAWSILSGSLPSGLGLASDSGEITGTPTTTGTRVFTIRVTDSGTSFPQSVQQDLTLSVLDIPGRNDSPGTATPLSNGTYYVSLSPAADPESGPLGPDNDYYALTAEPGAIVTVETLADRLTPASPMDSVIEIVDATGTRLTTCALLLDPPNFFTQPCVNDDHPNLFTLDSKLQFQVPGTPGTPVTFYVRVLDWTGNARPDFRYAIKITGAN